MSKTLKSFLFLSVLSSIFMTKIGYTTSLMSVAESFYYHAKNQNYEALKKLNEMGYQIDSTDDNGNSALCKAIIEKNHMAYGILKQMGANENHKCMQKLLQQTTKNLNQPKQFSALKAGALSTTAKVGIGAGIAVAIGGGVALASGGGGGGGASTGENTNQTDHQNPDNPDSPPIINPIPECGANAQYNGTICVCNPGYENFTEGQGCQKKQSEEEHSSEFINGGFLNQIKAQSAYDKGYTGYIVSTTNTPSTNQATNEKIKIGVWDSSVDVNQPDLLPNIAKRTFQDGTVKTFGMNTEIGPCKSGDTTNCYGIENAKESGNLVWYDQNGNQTVLTKGNITMDIVRTAFYNKYSNDYDWDEEQSKYNVAPKNSSLNSTTNIGDDHGTHVTGIIGATNNGTGIQGVVPDSQIYLATWTNNNYQNIDQYYASQFFADSGVRVVNASFGVPMLSSNGLIKTATEFSKLTSSQKENELSLGERLAYQTLAEKDIVIVKAVGNDGKGGQNEASQGTSIPMIDSFKDGTYDLTNLFIGAVAVDKNNKLASYSQYCGANAAWCMAAPGGDYTGDYYLETQQLKEKYENNEISQEEFSKQQKKLLNEWGIYSTVTNDINHNYIKEDGVSYGYMSGTSMATPVVTGAVGLLMSAYPHLSSQEVVEILFRTANKNLIGWGKTFESGYYDESTKTYTTTNVTDSLSTWTDSFNNTYNISKIYGHGMVDLQKAFTPLGDLQSPINNSTASKVSLNNTKLALPRFIKENLTQNLPKNILALDDYNRPFNMPITAKIKYAQRNTNDFKRAFKSFISPAKIQHTDTNDKLSFSFASTQANSDLLGLGVFDMNYKTSPDSLLKFSYRSDNIHEKQSIDQALSNPFLNMKNSYSLSQQLKYNNLSFSFGASIGQNAFYETDEDTDDDFDNRVNAFDSSIAYQPNKSVTFKMVGGILQEKDALLGMNGTGAFNTDDSITYFTGASVQYKPTLAFTLSANYYYGRSQMPSTGGLLKINNIITDSFALDARYQPDNKNTVGIQFSSPLRIRSSDAIFNIPVARDLYTDTIYFDKQKVSLKPNAREYDLGFYYLKETDIYDWRTNFTVRFNPDHIQNAKPDYRAIMGFSYRY